MKRSSARHQPSPLLTAALNRHPRWRASYGLAALSLVFLSAPQVAAQTAKIYLDTAVAAMGGTEALLAIQSQQILACGENFEPAQAIRPGASAPKVSRFCYILMRDFAGGRYRYEWQRETFFPVPDRSAYTEISDGYSGIILGADGPRSPRQRAASAARIAMRKKEQGRSPVSVLLTALSRQTSLLRLRDQIIRGRLHYVIAYDDGGKSVIVALDAQTRLLTRVQFLEDDPLHGDSHNELFYADWRQVGDIRMPFSSLWRVNGRLIMTERVESIDNNVPFAEEDFALPRHIVQADNGSPAQGELSSHWLLRQIAMASPVDEEQTRIRMIDVAPGVVHVTGGSHHSLGIAMADHVIVVEAPLYEARSLRVIDSLERRFPGKPPRTVINTHFHDDYAGGLRTYVAAGISLVTSQANAAFFQQVLGAPHTVVPDRLQRYHRPAVIETVDRTKKVLTDGQRTVEIYPVKNSHAEGMLMVFLPQEKLLFVTDLFSPGAPHQVRAWSRELVAAIEAYGLEVEWLLGGQGGLAPIGDVYRAAYE